MTYFQSAIREFVNALVTHIIFPDNIDLFRRDRLIDLEMTFQSNSALDDGSHPVSLEFVDHPLGKMINRIGGLNLDHDPFPLELLDIVSRFMFRWLATAGEGEQGYQDHRRCAIHVRFPCILCCQARCLEKIDSVFFPRGFRFDRDIPHTI